MPTETNPLPATTGGTITEVALNRVRSRTARHMVKSLHTAAHVLTAMEVDYEAVDTARLAHADSWKQAEGHSLTYLPFITRAATHALKRFPNINAHFYGDKILAHTEINIAVAVDLNFEGLIAPVLHNADTLTVAQISRGISDLATRAHTRKLGPDDMARGTFTLTNVGGYGTMMQFPIINQPQVAILSTDGIQRKPVAVTDAADVESIVVHPVGILALAWDHRAFDGAYAAAFLRSVKTTLETTDWVTELGAHTSDGV